MAQALKQLFLLDPNLIFLNHGSFGACPLPVFEVYQAWQHELERQPVEFLGRRAPDLMAAARAGLAAYVHAKPEEIVYFPNPTTAINMVARSLDLQPGDEILTSDHEYGAMNRTWRFVCQRTGAAYITRPVPLPVTTPQAFIEDFWHGVNERTKVIFISHITSSTALIFPVAELCARARQAGILSIIDGAHAPGQIPLDLQAMGADIYTGACHKWLCAPKGSAFVYARPEVQAWLKPLIVSWGYESDFPSASQFIDYHEWQGTRDLAAFLSVPEAIEFQARHAWPEVRRECHRLACETQARIAVLTGLPPLSFSTREPSNYQWYNQMVAVQLPQETDLENLKRRLYDEFQIEVPTILWNGGKFLRMSFQGYNDEADADVLVEALRELLNQE